MGRRRSSTRSVSSGSPSYKSRRRRRNDSRSRSRSTVRRRHEKHIKEERKYDSIKRRRDSSSIEENNYRKRRSSSGSRFDHVNYVPKVILIYVGNTPKEKKEVQVTLIQDAKGNGDDHPRQQTPRQRKTMKVIVLSKDTSSTPLYKL